MHEQALSSRLLTQQLSSPIVSKGPTPDQKEHLALKGTINAIKNPVQNWNYKQSATEAPKQDKPWQVKEAHTPTPDPGHRRQTPQQRWKAQRIHQTKVAMETSSTTEKELATQEQSFAWTSAPQVHMAPIQSPNPWHNLCSPNWLNLFGYVLKISIFVLIWKTASTLIWVSW